MSDKPQVGREIKRERRAVFYDKYNWPTMSIGIYSRTNRVFSFMITGRPYLIILCLTW